MLKATKNQNPKRRQTILSFSGLDRREGAPEGALVGSLNLSAKKTPYLGVREPRRLVREMESASGIGAYNGLYFIDGTDFWYKDKIRGSVSAGEKQIAVLGNRIVIFPDKLCYHIRDNTMEPMERSWRYTLPERNGHLTFSDNAITYHSGRIDDFSFKELGFRVGDAIEISGFYRGDEEGADPELTYYGENNKTAVIRELSPKKLTFQDGVFTAVQPNSTNGEAIELKKNVPDLTVLCEWNNRLWGAAGDTIYASKLGDPENFFVYEGISTDSFASAVGTGGAFTGCAVWGNMLYFFKEDGAHAVSGTKPSLFRIQWKPMAGVMAGTAGALLTLPDGLFYQSRTGFYLFDGALPIRVGKKLGAVTGKCVCSAYDGQTVYVSVADKLYTWQKDENIWLCEDSLFTVGMVYEEQVLYLLTPHALYAASGGNGRVSWSADFVPFSQSTGEKKRFYRLELRAEVGSGAYMEVFLAADNAPFKRVACLQTTGAYTVPFLFPPCENLHLRLAGKGACTVQEITLVWEKIG